MIELTDIFQVSQIFLSAFESESDINEEDNNTDVVVEMESGERYVATFYTKKNLVERLLLADNAAENQSHYFWVKNLVVIDNITPEHVALIVEEMINEGDFQLIFEKL